MNILGALEIWVILTMISPVLSIIMLIVGNAIKNKTLKNICLLLAFIIPVICILVLFGVMVPLAFLTVVFKGYNGIIGMITVVFTIWLVTSLIIQFKNRIIILKNNEKEIYIRDVDVNYSPAVVSYLMNNKIETKKDLSATLLNLCAKNILKIEKSENQKVNIIDLNNKKEVEKLSEDEKYAYEMFKTEVALSKISEWKNKVKEEYDKYKFSKENKINLESYLIYLYMGLVIVGIILTKLDIDINVNIWINIMIITFFSVLELGIFSAIKALAKSSEFIDTYTKKGALEYNKWKKFEKFIEEYTLVKEKEYENVVVLGEYLAYATALGINKKCDKELYDVINKKFDFDIFSYIDEMNINKN